MSMNIVRLKPVTAVCNRPLNSQLCVKFGWRFRVIVTTNDVGGINEVALYVQPDYTGLGD